MPTEENLVAWFEDLDAEDVPRVGGKNASLGEMIQSLREHRVRIPDGFATTAHAYRLFLEANELEDPIREHIEAFHDGEASLETVGDEIRELILEAELPEDAAEAFAAAYRELGLRYETEDLAVAVRSSATAEDLPEASFAGQQESFLNIRTEGQLLEACKRCYASLFTDRAISYREEQGFEHLQVALSVGVQKMVRADQGGAGVAFTLDTETGFPDVVTIDAAWGLGENVVQGGQRPMNTASSSRCWTTRARPIIVSIDCGAKQKKMVYGRRRQNHTTRNVDTSRQEKRQRVLSDDEILPARPLGQVRSRTTTSAPWTSSGPSTGKAGTCTSFRPAPRRCSPSRSRPQLKTYRSTSRASVSSRVSPSARPSHRARCSCSSAGHEADQFEDGGILVTEIDRPGLGSRS